MPTRKSPRKGSLQFWPRKRASKLLPRVNWDAIAGKKSLKGFILYKVGMASAHIKDKTLNSMTKDKKIAIPVTILACPPVKILSVRFYKNGQVSNEVLSNNLDKELKRRFRLPKKTGKKLDEIKDYDDLRVIIYSQPDKLGVKKSPDISEIGLEGSLEDKLKFAKEHFGKEISVSEAFDSGNLTDVRGLTKGKGLQGPVKRFGITLKAHKSEKGRRRPGSLAPWHPARVTFKTPMAGQLGMFTRITYNNKIVSIVKSGENAIKNIKNFGDVKTDYLIVSGSVQGPAKRALLATASLRPTKKQLKENFEFLELV
ncbi:MAG: 50S ribosomal protein L3 [Nanoarchaeota archaeon]